METGPLASHQSRGTSVKEADFRWKEDARTALLGCSQSNRRLQFHLTSLIEDRGRQKVSIKTIRVKSGWLIVMDRRPECMPTSGGGNSHLRRVLNVMFPPAYIELYHRPPKSVCSLLNLRCLSVSNTRDELQIDGESNLPVTFETSSEPSPRSYVLNLRQQFDDSLLEHRAKLVGLCPIRRSIYDQCFGRYRDRTQRSEPSRSRSLISKQTSLLDR